MAGWSRAVFDAMNTSVSLNHDLKIHGHLVWKALRYGHSESLQEISRNRDGRLWLLILWALLPVLAWPCQHHPPYGASLTKGSVSPRLSLFLTEKISDSEPQSLSHQLPYFTLSFLRSNVRTLAYLGCPSSMLCFTSNLTVCSAASCTLVLPAGAATRLYYTPLYAQSGQHRSSTIWGHDAQSALGRYALLVRKTGLEFSKSSTSSLDRVGSLCVRAASYLSRSIWPPKLQPGN